MSPCGVGSPVHLENQPASTVATLASVKPMVIRHIFLQITTELNTSHNNARNSSHSNMEFGTGAGDELGMPKDTISRPPSPTPSNSDLSDSSEDDEDDEDD